MADQLPGSGTDPLTGQPAKAGLFIPAKSERHAYSKPGAGSGTSVLGLDKLAAAKVAERGAMPPPGMRPVAKRPRETRLDHLHDGEAEGEAAPPDAPRDKNFRKPREPNPDPVPDPNPNPNPSRNPNPNPIPNPNPNANPNPNPNANANPSPSPNQASHASRRRRTAAG